MNNISKERDKPVDSSIPEEGEGCIGSRHVASDVVRSHEVCQIVAGWVVRIVLIHNNIDLQANQ